MKKIFLGLFVGITILSCNKKDQQKKVAYDGKINAESIFNLDSTWETMDGKEIKLADLQGNVLTVAMVYTSCTTACPIVATDMKNIQKKANTGNAKDVKYVFVSLDPENDTPERMKQFMKQYGVNGEQFLFLRGNTESTRELANVFGVRYKKMSPMEISHSNLVSVFTKGGDLAYQREGMKDGDTKIIEEIHKQL